MLLFAGVFRGVLKSAVGEPSKRCARSSSSSSGGGMFSLSTVKASKIETLIWPSKVAIRFAKEVCFSVEPSLQGDSDLRGGKSLSSKLFVSPSLRGDGNNNRLVGFAGVSSSSIGDSWLP